MEGSFYLREPGQPAAPKGMETMSALHAWLAAVLIIVVGLVTLTHLGVAIVPGIATAIHSVEHWLGEPLVIG